MMTRDEFVRFVTVARMGVVATVHADGSPEAALVALAVCDDGDLVFDTKTTARKVENIVRTGRVAIVIGWNKGVSIQVEGSAVVLAGSERARCGRIYEDQFPSSHALANDYSLVRVTPRWLRRYDARHGSRSIVEGSVW
jgi:pyridoxine/pyridoxamine 5'-phosphate oxidase